MKAFNWIKKRWAIIATILFLLSELIGEIPAIKESSVFGFVRDSLKTEFVREAPTIEKLGT